MYQESIFRAIDFIQTEDEVNSNKNQSHLWTRNFFSLLMNFRNHCFSETIMNIGCVISLASFLVLLKLRENMLVC